MPQAVGLIAWIPLISIAIVGTLSLYLSKARSCSLNSVLTHRYIVSSRYLRLTVGEFLCILVVVLCYLVRLLLYYDDFPAWSKWTVSGGALFFLAQSVSLAVVSIIKWQSCVCVCRCACAIPPRHRCFLLPTLLSCRSCKLHRVYPNSAYITGELNFINLAFIMLPVTRNSIWTVLIGISYERAIRFHRYMAYLTMVTLLVHGVGMWVAYADNGTLEYATTFAISPVTKWSNLSGMLALLCFLVMATTQLVRRTHWELFYYVHISFMPLGMVFSYLHMPSVLAFAGPAIFLYIVDLCIRAYKGPLLICAVAAFACMRFPVRKPYIVCSFAPCCSQLINCSDQVVC
jgi:hypothetical protein